MNALLQDFRYALRTIVNRPLYAFVTVLVLALAIGANTTVFSVFNGFFLRPLPYADDDRLVMVYNTYPRMGLEMAATSIPDYLDRREQAESLENLAIYTVDSRTLGGAGSPQQVLVSRASPSLFDVLGIAPQIGRAFTEDEASPGNEHVIVLSYALWNTQFGARADIVGKDVMLDGEPFRVVGVMPRGFGFPNLDLEAWVPFAFTAEQMSDDQRGQEFSMSVGRLRAGATIEGLNGELDAIVRRNVELGRLADGASYVETSGFTGRAQPLRDMIVGDLERMLVILQGIVLAVLLIACANVANLQLARMAGRRKELSVRAALGADRGTLARLVLMESLVVAAAGAAVGLAIAYGGLDLVRALGLDLARQGFEFALDTTVLVFTAGIALLAAVASALLPLTTLLRDDLVRAVQEAGRLGSGGRRAHGFRSGLVVVQIAASVALLVGAGLLTKSFYRMQAEGVGFEAENVWTARIEVPQTRYPDDVAAVRFYEGALAELAALPGVSAAGFTSSLPFSGTNWQGSYAIDGYTLRDGTPPPHGQHRSVSEGYLPSLGIPVVMGRNFDRDETERVVLVDQLFVNRFFPEGNGLGQRVRLDQGEWHTIVGVVPTVKHESLAEQPSKETIYWHYTQMPSFEGVITLRTALPPEEVTRAASNAILRVDPDVPLSNVMSMHARVVGSLGAQRASMVLTVVFAGVAFALAVIGIYGVLTWAVTQRHGEIGVRMALGARGADIVQMVVKQGGRLTALGLVLGIAGAVVLGRLLASQIQDVSPVDPVVFAVAVIGLGVAAMLASWMPAHRAARIDPMQALREE